MGLGDLFLGPFCRFVRILTRLKSVRLHFCPELLKPIGDFLACLLTFLPHLVFQTAASFLGTPIDLLFALTGRLTLALSALFGDSLGNLRKVVGVPRLGQRLLLGLLSSGHSRLCTLQTHFD